MHKEIGFENLIANNRWVNYAHSWVLMEATQLLHHPGLKYWPILEEKGKCWINVFTFLNSSFFVSLKYYFHIRLVQRFFFCCFPCPEILFFDFFRYSLLFMVFCSKRVPGISRKLYTGLKDCIPPGKQEAG